MKDATGSFDAGLGALFAITLAMCAVILLLRRQVRGREERPVTVSV